MARKAGTENKNSRPGRLRIVAGKWRSRLLPVVEHEGLRPSSERIRETLFNWIANDLHGSHCLDLFAGTGALGFEALSRGAESATLVEKSSDVARVLKENVAALNASGANIQCVDAIALLQSPPKNRFDIVFLDPPFADKLLEKCCQLLQSNGWLADHAIIYLEQERQ